MEWIVLTVALTLLASALGEMSGLGRADQTLYDAAMERLSQPAPEDIVIIAIDEPSLARIGRWPWRRAVHATLIEKVAAAKPRAIGIDLILAEPDARDPEGDRALARALQSHSRIVLPVLMEVRAGSVPTASCEACFWRKAAASGNGPRFRSRWRVMISTRPNCLAYEVLAA